MSAFTPYSHLIIYLYRTIAFIITGLEFPKWAIQYERKQSNCGIFIVNMQKLSYIYQVINRRSILFNYMAYSSLLCSLFQFTANSLLPAFSVVGVLILTLAVSILILVLRWRNQNLRPPPVQNGYYQTRSALVVSNWSRLQFTGFTSPWGIRQRRISLRPRPRPVENDYDQSRSDLVVSNWSRQITGVASPWGIHQRQFWNRR